MMHKEKMLITNVLDENLNMYFVFAYISYASSLGSDPLQPHEDRIWCLITDLYHFHHAVRHNTWLALIQISACLSDYFQSHVLAFSSNLDELNPGVSEWRVDIGRAVKRSAVQVRASAAGLFYRIHHKKKQKPSFRFWQLTALQLASGEHFTSLWANIIPFLGFCCISNVCTWSCVKCCTPTRSGFNLNHFVVSC